MGLILLTHAEESTAACSEPYSPCFAADNSWAQPYFDAGLGSARQSPTDDVFNAGLLLSYQRLPLQLVAASPDRLGNTVGVLDDWVTAQALFAWRIQRFELGAVLPFSLGGTGTGLTGATERSGENSFVGVGAPRLSARIGDGRGAWRWSVTQTLVVPLHTENSLLGSRGFGYAPLLSLQWSPRTWWTLLSLGARLQRSAPFGPVRFGSEAVIQAQAGVRLHPRFAVFIDTQLLPALARDEFRSRALTRVLRRVPAELLLGAAILENPWRLNFGIGTSLPLTLERSEEGATRFAGPPSPALRLQLRLDRSWD